MSYCTVEDLRAEGLEDSDENLERQIKLSCEFIDRITGQFFEAREQIIRLDGRGGKNLLLPYPVIEVEYIKVNAELISDYVIYNRLEDRDYPKIFRSSKWPEGRLNISIKGTWGYVEEDGSTPVSIKRIAKKLAMYNFPALIDKEAQTEKNTNGLLISETTDGHSYELASDAVTSAYNGAITGDAEIDSILKFYMRSRLRLGIA